MLSYVGFRAFSLCCIAYLPSAASQPACMFIYILKLSLIIFKFPSHQAALGMINKTHTRNVISLSPLVIFAFVVSLFALP